MTSRARFERWAKRQGISLERVQEVTRNGPRWVYSTVLAEMSWNAWSAGRRSHPTP